MAVRRAGFTVVELLTALVLTIAALSLTYGTFRLALTVEERGTARMELLQRADAAMEMMARDLRSAIGPGMESDYTFESQDVMEGDVSADTLTFVSTVNNPRAQPTICYDLARIRYYLDFDPDTPEVGLVRSQLNFPIPDDEEQQEEATRTMELLPTAESLYIVLYDNASGEWVENSDELEGTVGAVKLELTMSMTQQDSEEETAEEPETKTLALLVHMPASRWEPSEAEAASAEGEQPGGQAAEAGGEPAPPGAAGQGSQTPGGGEGGGR